MKQVKQLNLKWDENKLYDEESFNYYVSIMEIVGLLIILTIIVLNIMNLLSYEINLLINLCKLILCFVIFNIIYFKNYVEIENSFLWMKIYQTLKNRSKIQQNNNFNFRRNRSYTRQWKFEDEGNKQIINSFKLNKNLEELNIKKIEKEWKMIKMHELNVDIGKTYVNDDEQKTELKIVSTTRHPNKDEKILMKTGKEIKIEKIEKENMKEDIYVVKRVINIEVSTKDLKEGKILKNDERFTEKEGKEIVENSVDIINKDKNIEEWDIKEDKWSKYEEELTGYKTEKEFRQQLEDSIKESIKSIK